MRIVRSTVAVAGAALMLVGSTAGADESSHPGHAGHEAAPGHEHGGHGAAGTHSADLAKAWSALQTARDAIAADIAADRLGAIHEKPEPMPGLAESLREHTQDLEPSKRARVEGASRQISRVVSDLHEAADAGDASRAQRALERLDGLLALIRAQYPEGALSLTPAHDDSRAEWQRGQEHMHERAAAAEVSEKLRATVQVAAGPRRGSQRGVWRAYSP